MSASQFEAFLAKVYVEESARAQFLANPRGEALNAASGSFSISATRLSAYVFE